MKCISASTKATFKLLFSIQIFKDWLHLSVLSFENEADKIEHTGYYFPKVELKDYSIMKNGRSFFIQPIKITINTYKNIRKVAVGQVYDYTTRFLLDYICLRKAKSWLQ